MKLEEIEPAGTYRPQYHFRWRSMVNLLDRLPWIKNRLANLVRPLLRKIFEPGMVTTERVIEYPFVFQNIHCVSGPVLDLGCCSSRLPIALASRGINTIGIDVNSYPYRHPNLQSLRGDILHMPLAAHSIGTVLAVSVIEHIGIGHYGDPVASTGDVEAVKEIARVLRRGGRALITVPFGVATTDHFQRVYDPARLHALLKPLAIGKIEYAWSRAGLWTPCSEQDAATVDWRGPARAVALIVATAC